MRHGKSMGLLFRCGDIIAKNNVLSMLVVIGLILSI